MSLWQWRTGWLKLVLTGSGGVVCVSWLCGALLCFQDFETAALVQVNLHPASWTVWLFDARVATELLTRLLQFAAWPLGVQVVLLSGILVLLRRRRHGGNGTHAAAGFIRPLRPITQRADETLNEFRDRSRKLLKRSGLVTQTLALSVVGVGLWTLVGWPLFSSGGEFVVGVFGLAEQGTLHLKFGQVVVSYSFCVLAAGVSLWLAGLLHSFGSRLLTIVALLPGLIGSLMLSLILFAIVQWSPLASVRDSWLPMVLGQTLLLLPRAWLLVWLLRTLSNPQSTHSARLLLSSNDGRLKSFATLLLWRMEGLRWLLAAAVLSHWAFWDVAVASALQPVAFEPTVCRLYQEMHYDHTDTLMAMTVMSICVPFFAFLMAAAIGRWLTRKTYALKWAGASS